MSVNATQLYPLLFIKSRCPGGAVIKARRPVNSSADTQGHPQHNRRQPETTRHSRRHGKRDAQSTNGRQPKTLTEPAQHNRRRLKTSSANPTAAKTPSLKGVRTPRPSHCQLLRKEKRRALFVVHNLRGETQMKKTASAAWLAQSAPGTNAIIICGWFPKCLFPKWCTHRNSMGARFYISFKLQPHSNRRDVQYESMSTAKIVRGV